MPVTVDDISAKRKKLEQLGKDLAVAEERQRLLTEQLEGTERELAKLTGGEDPVTFLAALDAELEQLQTKIDTGLIAAEELINQMKGTGNAKAES
jgi:hypothetical protein